MSVLNIITLEQLRLLRESGYIVVHQVPTERMIKASWRSEWPEQRNDEQCYHRMVGESIKIQNEEIKDSEV